MSMNYDYNLVALAGAVLVLGLVIVLELRSVMRLRRSVEKDLARVFEQLDQLCFDNQQIVEGAQRAALRAATQAVSVNSRGSEVRATDSAAVVPFSGAQGRLAAGEARVLAALQAGRAQH